MGAELSPRLAIADDADVIARLLHDFNTEFDTPSPGVEVLAADGCARARRRRHVRGRRRRSARPLGLVTLRPNVWYAGPVALLDEMYVVPDRHGQGIGSSVLEHFVLIARARDVELIEINVDDRDVDAQRFYERHGFSSTDSGSTERAFYYFQELGV